MAQMHDIQICPEMRYSYSDPLHFIWWKQFGLTFKIHIMEIVETEREKGGFVESGIDGEKMWIFLQKIVNTSAKECEYFCKGLWIFLQKIVIVNISAKNMNISAKDCDWKYIWAKDIEFVCQR